LNAKCLILKYFSLKAVHQAVKKRDPNPQCNAMQCNAMQCNAMQCNVMHISMQNAMLEIAPFPNKILNGTFV
jgi:hypothetical protein